jgi:pyruvate carboxylase
VSTEGGLVFRKILVANRGEIAVRAFRAAYELGAATVAVFPWEDRNAVHRIKADEAYLIGERGHPVRAYLDVREIIRVAQSSGCDAVYPGYGFLSENPGLATAATAAGIAFIGPPAEVLELTGNKVSAVSAARSAGLPVLASTEPHDSVDAACAAGRDLGFPLFVKAVSGGGGRGMRRVQGLDDLRGAVEAAMREAEASFGDRRLYCEQAVDGPKHIEVQVVSDGRSVVHLHERDCSIQRRHQKVVEIAPAPDLDDGVRRALHREAVAYAQAIGYVNAGTVEFLVATAGAQAGRHVFIEMNPRIQVEHTVTEEVTDVDLVTAQIRIAAGESLADLGLDQQGIRVSGTAMQCRITTEDPSNGFRPDVGRLTTYRSPGGAGIRLDGGTAHAGAEIGPHFDSLLTKLTTRGRDFPTAHARARRALAEFRIRGVSTNIPFLQAVLADPGFVGGGFTTSFIDERPELLTARPTADRGTRLLTWLADVTVNQPHGPPPVTLQPAVKLPPTDLSVPAPAGSRQRLLTLGPQRFAAELRAARVPMVTDTTFRDAHQSLLATRVRTRDMALAAPHVARTLPGLLSLECWGGATYDVALRFLAEDPWERLATLRDLVPNLCLQMLLRGRNTVGYTPYPAEVTHAFVGEAARTGIDIFRIFDALNDVVQMRPAIDAVREQGSAVAEVALCYTADLLDPGEQLYTLDYYLRLAERIVGTGAHVLAIKDMAGLLRPAAARRLVTALRERFDLPVHLHTHDTAGGQLATLIAGIEAGVDAVDAATATMAGTTSQPSLSALVAACAHTAHDTGLSVRAALDLEPYWEAVRRVYRPFESGLPGPSGRVYEHEIPGGQLSNLRQQAIALGLGERFEKVESMYAAADRILGRLVKVTPSSKVVGDLALHLVATGADPTRFAADPGSYDLPDSVVGFLSGELGTPPGGWPEPFRTRALQGRRTSRAVTPLEADDLRALAADARPAERRSTLNRLLFPGPTADFERAREEYGDLSVLESLDYLYGFRAGVEHEIALAPGVRMYASLEAIGDPDPRGLRRVMTVLNGQLRPLQVRDRSVRVDDRTAERADPGVPGHVGAPFDGVVTVRVAVGDAVQAGDTVATIEAMKMEAAITAGVSGRVARLPVGGVQPVSGGDLVVVVE